MIENCESRNWEFTEDARRRILGQTEINLDSPIFLQITNFSVLTNHLFEDGGFFIDNETLLDYETEPIKTNLVLRTDQLDNFIIMLQAIQASINSRKEKNERKKRKPI